MVPKKKKKKKTLAEEEQENFNINVNSFGELESNMDIDKINAFLNENVKDKKLRPDHLDGEEE